MSEHPRIDYWSRPDISYEEEVKILAAVYGFLLDRHAEKAANQGRPEPEGGADCALRTDPEKAVIGKREKR